MKGIRGGRASVTDCLHDSACAGCVFSLTVIRDDNNEGGFIFSLPKQTMLITQYVNNIQVII